MLFWKDVGNGILLDRPLPFKLHQSYQRYRVLFPRCKKSGRVREKQCGDGGDDLNTARHSPVISLPLFYLQSRFRQECLLSDWGVLLFPKSLKTSGLQLFLKGMPPIYLNMSFISWVICDLASPTEEVCKFFLMNLYKSTFLIMC